MAFTERGRDWTFEPIVEEVLKDLRMDNAAINAATVLLHKLKTRLGEFVDPKSVTMREYLIGEVANVERVKRTEEMESRVHSFQKPQSKN